MLGSSENKWLGRQRGAGSTQAAVHALRCRWGCGGAEGRASGTAACLGSALAMRRLPACRAGRNGSRAGPGTGKRSWADRLGGEAILLSYSYS